ncbi:hypothetical protein C7H19_14040 [Aphanothece hegewaldii CCALA 016]|uniref:Glucuronyl hydrolase n=1 Tax=Aphanothece hegewaldii CCALA 016 TaxID=2107694 RepID=A0A2T1LWD5_9CHRO|nr:hypothetical protein C7H19_14040 [Aphanothece hegewaldii CCALA 016]
MLNGKKLSLTLIGLSLISLILTLILSIQTTDPRSHLNLEQRIDFALQLAQNKLIKTINTFEQSSLVGIKYPSYTSKNSSFSLNFWKKRPPSGIWLPDKAKFWSSGAFPALLWQMSTLETELGRKQFWWSYAKSWGEPLRKRSYEDVTINNLLVFRPWLEFTRDEDEKKEQLETILQGARTLAMPYDPLKNQGRFQVELGVMGNKRKADRTDNQVYWHVFTDHIINVEQLLWAAQHNPNSIEAKDWQQKAIRHIKTVGQTFGKNRKPGHTGTWQRGYFDDRPSSPTYRQFLFNEGKQGWRDDTTWSRGQAWIIYATSIAYKYSQDPSLRAIAFEAIDYYMNNLPDSFEGNKRTPHDFIPPWDFDYALEKNPNTERDSSAAAIAISGILKLIPTLPKNDPARPIYLDLVKKTLYQLTSKDYLNDLQSSEMSILQKGCYHHPDAIQPSFECDNGLIWGDYFFVDALLDYRRLMSSSEKD